MLYYLDGDSDITMRTALRSSCFPELLVAGHGPRLSLPAPAVGAQGRMANRHVGRAFISIHMSGAAMERFTSGDGTVIAWERSGSGTPLLLVHGTGVDHTYWDSMVPELGQRFTVHAMDRRGRGRSSDSDRYSMRREFEDVAALIDHISGPADVVAHSYGALCTLEAALLTTRIRRMVLYEPPIHTTVEVSYPEGVLDRYNRYLSAGEPEKALLMVYEAGQMSADELDALRAHPSWRARLSAAPTIPREVICVRKYTFETERFAGLQVPTLLLIGEETLPFYKEAAETLRKALPCGRMSVLPGEGHEAAITAPALVLTEVLRFLADDRNNTSMT